MVKINNIWHSRTLIWRTTLPPNMKRGYRKVTPFCFWCIRIDLQYSPIHSCNIRTLAYPESRFFPFSAIRCNLTAHLKSFHIGVAEGMVMMYSWPVRALTESRSVQECFSGGGKFRSSANRRAVQKDIVGTGEMVTHKRYFWLKSWRGWSHSSAVFLTICRAGIELNNP